LARQQKEAERRAASLPTVITRLPEHLHTSIISNGVLLLDKPKGWTACDCVNAVKSAVKQQKVGHVAPLDCVATGLMVLLLGEWPSLWALKVQKTSLGGVCKCLIMCCLQRVCAASVVSCSSL
jgi:hypothetical protein